MVGSNIPFLGVVIPNLVSLRYGDHMKNTLWLTGICGSLFLLICDILARVLIAPYEIPVSVVVGTLGSILFILLLLGVANNETAFKKMAFITFAFSCRSNCEPLLFNFITRTGNLSFALALRGEKVIGFYICRNRCGFFNH